MTLHCSRDNFPMQSSWIMILQELKDLHLKKFEIKLRRYLIQRKKKMMRAKSLKRLLSNDRINYYNDEITLKTLSTKSVLPTAYFWIDHHNEMESYHLMVQHSGSRIGSPWFQSQVMLTRAEAFALLKKYRLMILSRRKTFHQVANLVSACSAVRFSKHLREFRSGVMRYCFAQIVQNLPVGGVAAPVGTPSGVHLLMRTR